MTNAPSLIHQTECASASNHRIRLDVPAPRWLAAVPTGYCHLPFARVLLGAERSLARTAAMPLLVPMPTAPRAGRRAGHANTAPLRPRHLRWPLAARTLCGRGERAATDAAAAANRHLPSQTHRLPQKWRSVGVEAPAKAACLREILEVVSARPAASLGAATAAATTGGGGAATLALRRGCAVAATALLIGAISGPVACAVALVAHVGRALLPAATTAGTGTGAAAAAAEAASGATLLVRAIARPVAGRVALVTHITRPTSASSAGSSTSAAAPSAAAAGRSPCGGGHLAAAGGTTRRLVAPGEEVALPRRANHKGAPHVGPVLGDSPPRARNAATARRAGLRWRFVGPLEEAALLSLGLAALEELAAAVGALLADCEDHAWRPTSAAWALRHVLASTKSRACARRLRRLIRPLEVRALLALRPRTLEEAPPLIGPFSPNC